MKHRNVLRWVFGGLAALVISPIVSVNVEKYAASKGWDNILTDFLSSDVDWFVALGESAWVIFFAGFFLGGTIALWADYWLRRTSKPVQPETEDAANLEFMDEQPAIQSDSPYPDMTIRELFDYIAEDTDFLGKSKGILEDKNWIRIGNDIKDKMNLGRLAVYARIEPVNWLRNRGNVPLTAISQDYWRESQFTYQFFDEDGPDAQHTYGGPDDPDLKDVQVNRAQAHSIWPKKEQTG